MSGEGAMKKLIDYKLGENIEKKDAEAYFGKEFCELFNFPLKLVAVSWTFQDKEKLQVDYQLKHKDFIENEKECESR